MSEVFTVKNEEQSEFIREDYFGAEEVYEYIMNENFYDLEYKKVAEVMSKLSHVINEMIKQKENIIKIERKRTSWNVEFEETMLFFIDCLKACIQVPDGEVVFI